MKKLNLPPELGLATFALAAALILIPSARVHAMAQPDCVRVCKTATDRLQLDAKAVKAENELWTKRLGLKGDVVAFPAGYSASEELLAYMSRSYSRHSFGNQMDKNFLAYLMVKCFPDTYVGLDYTKLSGLVNTLYVARHMRIERDLNRCR